MHRSSMRRLVFPAILCSLLAGQQQQPQQQDTSQLPSTTIRTTVDIVVAPVLVTDRDGQNVSGIQPEDFHLFDNGKAQNIHVDGTYQPISLVICIQANSHVESILAQVKKIGNLIAPLIFGEQGEAAIIAYDSRIRTLQEFTSDPDKITKSVKDLYAGSTSNRLIDAVSQGARMLRTRRQSRRRIMLAIGETRDNASETRLREALLDVQYSNVLFYAVDMSRFISTLTAKPDPGRQNNLPPAMHPMPSGVPATPTTVAQTYGLNGGRAEFIPMMVELFRDVKAIFKDNPIEAFTKGTGGTELGFVRQRGLEEAIQRIGAELHSQYLVSYTPNNTGEGGFHEIAVTIQGHRDYKTQTRPGYYLGIK